IRDIDGGVLRHDYSLTNAPRDTPPPEFARVAKALHRVEECLRRSKSEAGVGEDRGRDWGGWRHPKAAALSATGVLGVGARRGEKGGAGVDGATGEDGVGADPAPSQRLRRAAPSGGGTGAATGPERVGAVLSLQVT